MTNATAHKGKPLSGVAVVNCIEDAIVAHERLEPVLWVALDPTVQRVNTQDMTEVCMTLLKRSASACRDRTIRVNLRMLIQGGISSPLKVDKGLSTSIICDDIRKVYR